MIHTARTARRLALCLVGAAAGVVVHLADPGETAAARGKKRPAKTDLLTELPEVLAQLTA